MADGLAGTVISTAKLEAAPRVSFCWGEAVPMPVLPEASITKGVVSEAESLITKELPEPRLVKVKAAEVAETVLVR
ncbi:MAG: hypothetical protein WA063_01240, partial [Minisyncoccia bacterium]